jgi:hypothetical protein
MMMKWVAVAWSLATGRADVLDGVSDGEGDGCGWQERLMAVVRWNCWIGFDSSVSGTMSESQVRM